MNQASDEVLLNVYEFSSPLMADTLITAHAREVDIKIIIEGGPVGGISPEGKEAIRKLDRQWNSCLNDGITQRRACSLPL